MDAALLAELTAMGFPEARAARALHFSPGGGVEGAVAWLAEREGDEGLDEPLLVPKVGGGSGGLSGRLCQRGIGPSEGGEGAGAEPLLNDPPQTPFLSANANPPKPGEKTQTPQSSIKKPLSEEEKRRRAEEALRRARERREAEERALEKERERNRIRRVLGAAFSSLLLLLFEERGGRVSGRRRGSEKNRV